VIAREAGHTSSPECRQIAALAKAAGGVVFFIDEAGVRSDYHAGTTWAPVELAPMVVTTGARFGLTVISAIRAKGALRLDACRPTPRCSGQSDPAVCPPTRRRRRAPCAVPQPRYGGICPGQRFV
jgi:hypothetical protein